MLLLGPDERLEGGGKWVGGKVGKKMAYPVFWRRSFFWRLFQSLEGEGGEKMFRLPYLSVARCIVGWLIYR